MRTRQSAITRQLQGENAQLRRQIETLTQERDNARALRDQDAATQRENTLAESRQFTTLQTDRDRLTATIEVLARRLASD